MRSIGDACSCSIPRRGIPSLGLDGGHAETALVADESWGARQEHSRLEVWHMTANDRTRSEKARKRYQEGHASWKNTCG